MSSGVGKLERIDNDFEKWMNKIKCERVNKGIDKKPIGSAKITKEMMRQPSFYELEKELLREEKQMNKQFNKINLMGKKNKKGSILDLVIWIVIGLVFVLFIAGWIYVHGIFTGVMVALPNVTIGSTNISLGDISNQTVGVVDNGLQIFRWVSVGLILAMLISIVISCYFAKGHPAFYVFYVFAAVIIVIASAALSNAYEAILVTNPFNLQTFSPAFNFIFLHLPVINAAVAIIGAVVLFSGIIKDESSAGGNPFG